MDFDEHGSRLSASRKPLSACLVAGKASESGVRLLLVEDDPLLGRSLEQRLTAAGYVVDWVLCGEDAEAAAAATPFSLVLLDRRLPDGDGVGRITTLRRFRPNMRVLVLTALDATPQKMGELSPGRTTTDEADRFRRIDRPGARRVAEAGRR